MKPRRPNQFAIRVIRVIRGTILFGCGWPRWEIRGKIFAKMSDFAGRQYTLFPRLRREKVAPQPAGFQQLVSASTNMLVFVFGPQ